MMTNYRKIVVGELATNCYLFWNQKKEVIIIDPGDEGTEIAQEINTLGLTPKMILLTHGHFDHLMGAAELQLIYKIPILGCTLDQFLIDRAEKTAEFYLKRKIILPKIKIDQVDNLNSFDLKIIKTPGHTPGGLAFYDQKNKLLFCGDTLFAHGFIGDTRHDYSSSQDLSKSIKQILSLPDNTVILPGHGEETTVADLRNFL